jgi:hypothetical protein
MPKKTTKPTKKTKPIAKKAIAKAKLDQRPVILSAPRPKKVSAAPTLSAARSKTQGAAKAKAAAKPKAKLDQRPVTMSAPRPKKPARKPAAKPLPSTIAPAPGTAPYYPDYEPKGELWSDFAPMALYIDDAASLQDLRERMLFRRTLGNHPEDVLVAGKRKARSMGWNLDAYEVEQPGASAGSPAESAEAPEVPKEMAAPADAPEQSASAIEPVEHEQPAASATEPAQPEVLTPESTLSATAPEHQEEAAS